MDLGTFKHPDKKSALSTRKELCTKIPVPLNSPRNKKPKRQKTNNIVCSTPLNAAKRKMFEDDIQEMSPIPNPSSRGTSKNSSPIRLIDEEELVMKLQIKKNSCANKDVPENPVISKKEMEDSLYHFPLVNNVPILKMVLCDSDNEIFPEGNKNKRSKKPIKQTSCTSDVEKNLTKNSSEKIILENKQTVQTRSNANIKNASSENIFDKSDINKDKKKVNTKTKNKTVTTSPDIKKIKTETIYIVNKIDSGVQLRNRIEKVKKDVLNGQTKNSTKIKTKTGKAKKEILNGAVKNDTNIHVLEVSDGTKTTVVVHNDNNKISEIKSIDSANLNGAVENSENINEIKFSVPKRKGRKQKNFSGKNSIVTENSQEVRKSSRERVPSCKYWIHSEPPIDNSFEEIEKRTKHSSKSAKLKNIQLPAINEKCTRKFEKLQNDDLPLTDQKLSRKSLKLQTAELSAISKTQKTRNNNKKSSSKSLKSETNDLPIVEKQMIRTHEKTKTDEPEKVSQNENELQEDKIPTGLLSRNKRLSIKSSKSSTPKTLTVGKLRKSLVLEQRVSRLTRSNKRKTQTKLEFSSKEDENYTTEEENDIPRDTVMLPSGIEGIHKLPSIDNRQKRKVESNIEFYQPKKVKLQTNHDYSFKNIALSVDVIAAKAGGLADVQIDGKRCLLGCFGKFPRHLQTTPQNSDISVGTSIHNGHITTGVLEIEPAGRKKYEYAKRVDLLFIILGGTAEVGIGNSSQVLRLGQDFYVPKDTPYYIWNVSNTEKLLIYFSKILRVN